MANALGQNPLVLDTAHASNVVIGGGKFIHAIHFVGATGVNHICRLDVKATNVPFYSASAAVAGDASFNILDMVTPGDLILPVLASGTLFIYLGSG